MRIQTVWKNIPYFCIACYIAFIIFSLWGSIREMNLFFEHPYQIARDVSRVRSRLQILRGALATELSRAPANHEEIARILAENNQLQDSALASLGSRLPESARQLVPELEVQVQAVRAAYRIILSERLVNSEQFFNFYNREVEPRLDALNSVLHSISLVVDEVAEQDRRNFILQHIIGGVLALCLGLVLSLVIYFSRKREREHINEIVYREELFNLLSHTVDDVFFISGSNGVVDYASTNSERVLEIPAAAIRNRTGQLGSLIGQDSAQWLIGHMEDFESREPCERDVDIRGTNRKLKIRIYPVLDDGARVERHIVVISDQTQLLERQQALRDALENSRRASAAKSRFLGQMSHEIRTPMNAIIGMTHIARNRLDDRKRVVECLEKIGQSSRHLLSLLNDMLDLSRIEGGNLEIREEPFNLQEVVDQVAALTGGQAATLGLKFNVDISGLKTAMLIGDAVRLQQILIHILSNALKFTPRGGAVDLIVAESGIAGGKCQTRFVTRDTGIGMSETFLRNIFQPFEQASQDKSAGAGLGMAITRNLVSLMGGTIHVSSKEWQGTEVTVVIPFLPVQDAPTDLTLANAAVLVIDPDPEVGNNASQVLQRLGARADLCQEGQQALRQLEARQTAGDPYDICMVALRLPDMNILEFSQAMAKIAGTRPRLVLMSYDDPASYKKLAAEAGADACLQLPLFPSTLYSCLSPLLDPPEQAPTQLLSGKRVLLVDDNEFNCEIGTEFLEMAGMEVEQAHNGSEAVEMFSSSDRGYYSAICMDLQMPVMDGLEAARRIRASAHADAKTIPIVAMSANSFQEDIQNSRIAGMDAHIAKPVNIQELHAVLAELLARGRR